MFLGTEFWQQPQELSIIHDSWADQLQVSQEPLAHHSYLQAQGQWLVLKHVSAFSKPTDSLVTALTSSSETTNATHSCVIISGASNCTKNTSDRLIPQIVTLFVLLSVLFSNTEEGALQHLAVLPGNTKELRCGQCYLSHFLLSQWKPARTNHPAHSTWAGNELWENMFDHKGACYTE